MARSGRLSPRQKLMIPKEYSFQQLLDHVVLHRLFQREILQDLDSESSLEFLLIEGAALSKLTRIIQRTMEVQALLRKNKVFRLISNEKKDAKDEIYVYVNLVDKQNSYFGTPFVAKLRRASSIQVCIEQVFRQLHKIQDYDNQRVQISQFDFPRLDFIFKQCISSKGSVLDKSCPAPYGSLLRNKSSLEDDCYLDIMFRHLMQQEETRVLRIQ